MVADSRPAGQERERDVLRKASSPKPGNLRRRVVVWGESPQMSWNFHSSTPLPLRLPLRAACNNRQPAPAPAVLVQATILAWRGRGKV